MANSSNTRMQGGVSLIEVMLVVVVIGISAGMAVPRFGIATEQAHVDIAAGTLRSVWLAERLWWLERREFSDSLDDLADNRLIDRAMLTAAEPFELQLLSADEGTFTARMQRSGSDEWSGELVIDESGVITGWSTNEAGLHVVPQGS